MTDLIFALALLLFGRDGAVVPLRPAPLVIQPGTLETIPEPLPYVLYAEDYGPGR